MIFSHHHHHPLCFLHVVLFILIISPLTSTAQTHTNISLGSSLSTPTTKTTPSWTSPSGDFAFGFRPLPNDTTLFILAIYVNNIPEKTIVWSANGDNPAQTGSKVTLTREGRLNLTNPSGQEIWTSHEGGGAVTHAAMLDNGNLVLAAASSSNNAWESFNQPTDTILPSQELGLGSALLARITETNYSSGRFTLRVQTDGNLVLYYIDQITKNIYGDYWASNTVGSGVKLVFDVSGSVYFALKNNTVFNVTKSGVSAKDYYQRATLDPDGVFRQYIYPKTNKSTLNNAWSLGAGGSVASDICTASRFNFGSGVCGFNSYCKPDTSQNMACECPKGYSFLDENLKYKGCKPDFTAQSCDVNEGQMYQLEEMLDVDWPLADYETYNPIDEDQCRSLCLEDCFCAVAIFRQGSCWKKKLPLSNGRKQIGVGRALIKVSIGNSTTSPPQPLLPDSNGKHKDRRPLVIVGSLLLGSSAFLNIIFISAILIFFLCPYNKIARMPRRDMNILQVNLQSFTYKELEEVTDKFREELGRGAFGIVYKGVLNYRPAIHVAVKKLNKMTEDTEREGRLDALVNSDEEAMSDTRRLERFLKVALWCIQEDPSLRPPMKKVSQMLEGAVEVDVPPDSSSFISSIN
ncbi:G-type lectin S-receptor-like serine/threonine-protein kinase RLK1 [Acorus gramineus]|uniref:G-type lectin S-receptor-like serine/threonine-protein kinase RLK1 n=1 Tax=Acorus gramineus TaxID=55184 RepID=A0AAV9AT30_ACOGR|nr:G-type lectin S-receptor-like serine/threonine-protein kinase RLK1 [Acorus gramineus]